MLIYRRGKTLKNLLAPSLLKSKKLETTNKCKTINSNPKNKKIGCFKCSNAKCKCCTSISDNTHHFSSYHTKETFLIHFYADCGSSFLIYLIVCKCGLQYVGRTSQTLRTRLNNHRHNITKGFTKHSLSHHASTHHECRMEDFCITVIEKISENVNNRLDLLAKCEMYWIF